MSEHTHTPHQSIPAQPVSATWQLETTIAALEGGARAQALSRGEDALLLAVLHVAEPGAHVVVAPSLFGAHTRLFTQWLPEFQVSVDVVEDPDDAESWRAQLGESTVALIAESIADPRGDVLDFEEIAAVAHEHDAALIIDSTAATPALLRPLDLGADLVVHTSVHLLAGVPEEAGLLIDAGTVEPAARETHEVGQPLVEDTAAQILAGLQHLAVRLTRQTENAARLAARLSGHQGGASRGVHRTYYSGLASSPCYERAGIYLRRGSGPLVSFEVRAQREPAAQSAAALAVVDLLSRFAHAGHRVTHPASSTHAHMGEDQQREAGVRPGLVRVVVGDEPVEEFLAALDQALAGLPGTQGTANVTPYESFAQDHEPAVPGRGLR